MNTQPVDTQIFNNTFQTFYIIYHLSIPCISEFSERAFLITSWVPTKKWLKNNLTNLCSITELKLKYVKLLTENT
jgi:hypothetical protein